MPCWSVVGAHFGFTWPASVGVAKPSEGRLELGSCVFVRCPRPSSCCWPYLGPQIGCSFQSDRRRRRSDPIRLSCSIHDRRKQLWSCPRTTGGKIFSLWGDSRLLRGKLGGQHASRRRDHKLDQPDVGLKAVRSQQQQQQRQQQHQFLKPHRVAQT